LATAAHSHPGAGLRHGVEQLFGGRELVRTLLRRELRAKYKGSAAGVLWSYIYPLLMMGVYVLVFSVLWRVVTIEHYPLFVLSGLAVWAFFQASVHTGVASLPGNAHIIKTVRLPRGVFPTVAVLAQVVSVLVVMFAVIVPINLIVAPESRSTVLLAVPLLAALILLTLGVTWLLATANVFLRDVEHLVAALFLPWFFLTPVLYSLNQLPGAADHPWLIDLLRYGNPITPYVESIRAAVLQGVVVGPGYLLYTFVVGPLVALLGLAALRRYQDRFAVEL
jgi:ABC-type polysaccharide/polyol phosphate export permease